MTEPTSLSQSTESVTRLISASHTDGRTDGRTENDLTAIEHLTAVDARAADNPFSSFGRYDVVRIGEREPIPFHIRTAVWYRDDGRCDLCADGERITRWELDHMVPWSAGGSDQSTNLRVLCARHNQERSNWHDMSVRYRRPVTWWCINCYSEDERWEHYPGAVRCPTHPHGMGCRVVRAYTTELRLTQEVPRWHAAAAVTNPTTLAYCAHCDAPGLTDRPL